jgi:hypothetical protein
LDQARALNFNAGFWRAVWLFSAGLLVAPLGFGAALLYGGTSALGSLAISVLSDGYQAYDKINAYIYKSDLGRYKTITYTYDYHALSTGPGYERISNTIRIYGNGPMCTSANLMAYNDPYRYGAALAQCGMVVYAYSWKRNHFPY